MSPKPNNWHAREADEIFKEFQSGKNGLTDEEAGFRRQQYGFNELPKKKRLSKLAIFIAQFRSALIYILLVAALVSFSLGERIDAQIILAAILINVAVGFVQENKAQTALASLSEMVTRRLVAFTRSPVLIFNRSASWGLISKSSSGISERNGEGRFIWREPKMVRKTAQER